MRKGRGCGGHNRCHCHAAGSLEGCESFELAKLANGKRSCCEGKSEAFFDTNMTLTAFHVCRTNCSTRSFHDSSRRVNVRNKCTYVKMAAPQLTAGSCRKAE